jgi:hypothetical protein
MRNLCKGGHCVRKALERDGYDLEADGTLRKREALDPLK